MYREVSKLLLYCDIGQDSILSHLCSIFEEWEKATSEKQILIKRIYKQVKRLLDLATKYGFDGNLWHNYLVFLLMTNENSFSLTCERVGVREGSVNQFAKSDLAVFRRLFDFDFSKIESDLDIDCFSVLSHYRAIAKNEQRYNRDASEKIQALTLRLTQAKDVDAMFRILTDYYRTSGLGIFGFNRAFRIKAAGDEQPLGLLRHEAL